MSMGEVIVVIGSRNVGQLISNVERVYPGYQSIASIEIIDRGMCFEVSDENKAITLNKGDRVRFS